jgi:tRNA(Ile)-lysidine synthase
VVLLHALARHLPVRAVHVHHGLSANAGDWARFCRSCCRALGVPLTVRRVRVSTDGEGVEAAAREARYAVFEKLPADAIALAHQLDDQAETVLMNLLRGAGARGASGMPAARRHRGKLLVRPLLDVPREAIVDYARRQGLAWIEDESNAAEHLTRNFIRRRVAPLIAERYPRWREALARAARHFSRTELDAQQLVRRFLADHGLRAPSEAKLAEMVRQLVLGASGALIEHDGARWRLYRGKLVEAGAPASPFPPIAWRGERRVPLPALGGELVFRRVRGAGIDAAHTTKHAMVVRLRTGGERLQPDARRPRRTLKNLFQEAGVPAWQRDRLPLLFDGDTLVWAPGLGIDARYQAKKGEAGWLPHWRAPSATL